MSKIERVDRAIKHPVVFGRGANRAYHRHLHRRSYNTAGVAIFEEDWDNLLILDACRYDLFAARSDLPGRLESRRSRGSATTEFLYGNFHERDLRDTVYVTANPQFHKHRDKVCAEFHSVINLWKDKWDDEHDTVLPETVTETAERVASEYPNKRLLVHYLQPHYPFIGAAAGFDTFRGDERNVWNQIFEGTLDIACRDIRQMYAENLDRALPYVRELMDTVRGKTVVTADHGNMIGERAFPIPVREWGHPRGIYTDELITVPWLIREDGDRRSITAENAEQVAESDVSGDKVDQRLRDLGYVE